MDQVEPCRECGSTSQFHRRHPITDLEIDYDHACGSCVHETRTGGKRARIVCSMNREYQTPPGQSRQAYPACTAWKGDPVKVATPEPIEATVEA